MKYRSLTKYMYSGGNNKYLNSYKFNYLELCNTQSKGSSTNINWQYSLKAAIGEALERYSLVNFSPNNQKELIVYNLYTRKFEYLKTEDFNRIYLEDTCGLSTHLSSNQVIEAAFNEFIERQSFILSYLAKRPKYIIAKDNYFKMYVPEIFHFLNFYEISIIDSYKVVLAIGQRSKNTIDLALGAGINIKTALEKVCREIVPFESCHDAVERKENEHVDYLHVFKKIPINKILEAYDYLVKGKEKSILNLSRLSYDSINSQFKQMGKSLCELKEKYEIEPLVLAYTNEHLCDCSNNYKAVKVFANNTFPSLKVTTYTESVFLNMENKFKCKLKRNVNFIPFP